MKKIILVSLVWAWSCLSLAYSAQEKISEIEQYEIRSYDPKASGLTDLVFEARIENLTELLISNCSISLIFS